MSFLGNTAAAFAKAISSDKAGKTMKAFAGAMKSLEEVAKTGGLQDLKNLFGKVQDLLGSPLMIPAQILLARLAAGTADNTVKLLNTMLSLLESGPVETAITAAIVLINLIVLKMDDIGGMVGTALTDMTNFFTLMNSAFKAMGDDIREDFQAIADFFKAIFEFFFGKPDESAGTTTFPRPGDLGDFQIPEQPGQGFPPGLF